MMQLLQLAARNVMRNKGRSILSVAALLIGVCQMIFGQSGINGMEKALIEDAVLSKIGAIQIYRTGYVDAEQDLLTFDLPDDPALIGRLRAVPGVRAVSRRIYFEGMISNGSISTVFVATAIDPRTEYEVCPRRRDFIADGGTPLGPADQNGALIGKALAKGLGVGVGGTLVVSSATAAGVPNAVDVTVRGTLPEGSRVESKASVMVPLELAQTLLRMPGRVTEYIVHVDDLQHVERIAASLRKELGAGFDVKTWRDRPQIRDIMRSMAFIMGFVAFLLSLLVVTVIVNTMLMSIYERVREIGTMMAIGVRRRQVLAMILLESAVLGLLGASVGALLGVALSRFASGRVTFPATELSGPLTVYNQISATYVLTSIAIAVLVAICAASYPAWKASRMKPIDALRAT